MQKANIGDRASVEALYPLAAFEEDAGRNALDRTQVVYGIRIDSEPDAEGWFALVRARHHVGELTGFKEAIFLAPQETHLTAPLLGNPEGEGVTPDPAAARREEYRAFIDRVIEAARAADFQDPIGRGEERLKGFHGG